MFPGSNKFPVAFSEKSLISSLLPLSPYSTNETEPPCDGRESSAVFMDNLNSPSVIKKTFRPILRSD